MDNLRVIKHEEAMDTDDKGIWDISTDDECDNVKHVLKVTPRDELSDDGTTLPNAWTMKKKSSGRHKNRLNACEHSQKDGENYDVNNAASPVVNEVTLRVELSIMLILRALGFFLT